MQYRVVLQHCLGPLITSSGVSESAVLTCSAAYLGNNLVDGAVTFAWHTFRHSYATQLKSKGEDVKVVQESLRHANNRITLDT